MGVWGEAGGEVEVVHVLGALADGVLGMDLGAVGVALLDGLLHLELPGKGPPPEVCYSSRVSELSKYGFIKCIVSSLVYWLVEFY